MFDRRTKFIEWLTLRKKTFYHPIILSMTTLSDNKQGILCTEQFRGLVLIESNVKNIAVAINKEKYFTNWCKEITQGLMGFDEKTAGCSNSRRISHCLNRHKNKKNVECIPFRTHYVYSFIQYTSLYMSFHAPFLSGEMLLALRKRASFVSIDLTVPFGFACGNIEG